MNTKALVTLLREEIEKTGYKCYSPDLPQNEENCVAIYVQSGKNERSLNQDILYSTLPLYVLIRGTSNDAETRNIADKIFKILDMRTDLETDEINLILISCSSPNYAFRDDNQRIIYNINCTVKVQWKEEI